MTFMLQPLVTPCSSHPLLRVFFRGLLRALPPLYLHALELLQEVSRARPLPYLTCFTLPGSLSGVLGPSGADLLEMEPTGRGRRPVRRASKATLLSRLFGEDGDGEGAKRKRRVAMGVQKAQRLKEDLGSVVLQRTSHAMSMGFVYLCWFALFWFCLFVCFGLICWLCLLFSLWCVLSYILVMLVNSGHCNV